MPLYTLYIYIYIYIETLAILDDINNSLTPLDLFYLKIKNSSGVVLHRITFMNYVVLETGSHCSSLIDILLNPPLAQNGRYFADDIFRCIFVKEKFCILIKFHSVFT